MMKKTFLALCLTVGLAVSAWGHVPAGQQYLAFQFPAGSEPTLDGDLSEWAAVPQDYWIGPEHHVGGDGSQWTDLSDMNSKIIVGYSASTDRIYVGHEYFDDYRIRDFADLPPISGLFGDVPKLPDTFEIQVDGDHGGEDHWFDAQEDGSPSEDGSRWAQNVHYRYPDLDPASPNTNVEQTAWAWQWYTLATWTGNRPWSALGYTSDALELNATDVSAQAEIMFTAWDNLQWDDPDGSVVHDMVEGQTIGMNWQISDYDNLDDNDAENWYLSGDTTAWLTSSTATDFLLAPLEDTMTGVEAESWGRVKAAFTQ